ncbi:YlxM family DNA-binding protein [Mycoplasma putrefaciens]|uniref:UPF0122 protein MPUT9231_4940 n=2 Tax=Mycoplasma putrefaciens TaxID=2123 RepID=M9WCP6_9MOLU|nr:DNA-binding protein [Mycoplasma putrefaciens]AEM68635.1 uncharacterized protein MPUT_0253 [Mycoplasma putrefaciens KS1]AGJ90902.1 Hypothetical protein, probable regulator involved in transcription or translation [Mycoplasma putrefaciens Mput9231]
MNHLINKTVNLSSLFRIYQDLLTSKQKQYFELYIDENWSLNEIAEEFAISKAAVYDSITKTTKLLEDWEAKLQLKQKQDKLNLIIAKLETNCLNNQELIAMLKEVS